MYFLNRFLKNCIDKRMKLHNDPEYHGCKTTKRFTGPWKLIWKEEHETRTDALKREKQIKKRGISRFLESKAQWYSPAAGGINHRVTPKA